jgi:O-antigen/teichoic acid export membrane protein
LKQLDVTYGMLLLGALSSETQAGYFRVALSTIIFVSTPLSIFNVVLAPALARLFAQGERDRLQRILTLSALAGFCCRCPAASGA